MKPSERKLCCDLINLVANAVATGTIPEAQDYLQEKYDEPDELIDHTFNILTIIYNKQTAI